jgi:hypothetical protein
MAYLYNIPQGTDKLSISQANTLNNFVILGAIAGNASASSTSINATSGFNWVYLPPQGSIPPAGSAFTAGNVALYSALNSGSGQNELYINRTNPSSTVIQIPLTAYNSGTVSGASAVSWGYLPSGMLMISGKNITSGGTVTITFASTGGLASFPGFSSYVSSIQLTPVNPATSAVSMRVISFNLSQAVVGLVNGTADQTFFWTATGL